MTAFIATKDGETITLLGDTAMLSPDGTFAISKSKFSILEFGDGVVVIAQQGPAIAHHLLTKLKTEGRSFTGLDDFYRRFAFELERFQASSSPMVNSDGYYRCMVASTGKSSRLGVVYGPAACPHGHRPFIIYDALDKVFWGPADPIKGDDVDVFEAWRFVPFETVYGPIFGIGDTLEELTLHAGAVRRRVVREWPDTQMLKIDPHATVRAASTSTWLHSTDGLLGIMAGRPVAVQFDVDATMAANSDDKFPSQRAVRTAIASATSHFTPASSSGPASIDFAEDTDNGANRVRVTAPAALAADRTFILPDADVTLTSYIAALLNSTTSAGSQVAIGVRQVLTADRTYYVRTDGSDSNNGLANTSGGAFLTIQKAVDTVASLDLSIYNVTIQVADGTYAETVTLKNTVGSGRVTILGNSSTPANVVVSPASGPCFALTDVRSLWTISSLKTVSAGGALQITCTRSVITLSNLNYGAAASGGIHLYGGQGSRIAESGNYTISGAAGYHLFLDSSSGYYASGSYTVTITGTPAWGTAFAYVTSASSFRAGAITVSGSSTGPRYSVTMNGVIDVAGAGASALPGNSAGSTATGGQYA